MELAMPITRKLLSSGNANVDNELQHPKPTVQPGPSSVNKLSLDAISLTVGKISETNKYKKSVARRNERERRRVQHVNRTFDTLRNHVQGYKNANKKMSKVETLRCAAEYIRELRTILGLSEEDAGLSSSSIDDPANTMVLDYPLTPTTPTSPGNHPSLSFGYHSHPMSPNSSHPSSPVRSPYDHPPSPMETSWASCSLPTSPMPQISTCTTMPADRFQTSSAFDGGLAMKQEPTDDAVTISDKGNLTATPGPVTPRSNHAPFVFDYNSNSIATIETTESVLDEQSYEKIAAALQQHADQLGSLHFSYPTYLPQ